MSSARAEPAVGDLPQVPYRAGAASAAVVVLVPVVLVASDRDVVLLVVMLAAAALFAVFLWRVERDSRRQGLDGLSLVPGPPRRGRTTAGALGVLVGLVASAGTVAVVWGLHAVLSSGSSGGSTVTTAAAVVLALAGRDALAARDVVRWQRGTGVVVSSRVGVARWRGVDLRAPDALVAVATESDQRS